ncbi:cholesterol 7-alpha-monooxygenase [Crotalus adamanteus]|uniref:Cholesterol 7-alpha-monooxygenase n=1 Tax=Crotalus adamanteus TaxID=8729 RepID=A0AAW1BMA4_CROAD
MIILCSSLWYVLRVRRRHPGEPPLENGMLPYLGCALQFGVDPLKFLRERQKKHGSIFTCQLAGKYVHFLTDPFSYHAMIQQGRNLDWKKFHFTTSAKAFGHASIDPSDGFTTENMHHTFTRTLQANTIPATFWSSFYLIRNLSAMKAATKEAERVLKDAGEKICTSRKPICLNQKQLDDMPILDSIIKEALRLSSASMTVRVAKKDFILQLGSDSYNIRKDDIIAVYPQLLHLDPEIYPDPLTFKFDRYLGENGEEKTFYLSKTTQAS